MTATTDEFTARRSAFRRLHESGCFVMPNPWDIGSAKCLEAMGFPALATTSAGFAFTHGLPDDPEALSRGDVLRHVSEIVAATRLPVNADFQAGYARDAAGVAESVRLCVETGVAGLSIEDATGDGDRPLFEIREAVERVRAARRAIDACAGSGAEVLLTARAEFYLMRGDGALHEAVQRLEAYAEAGADVLFAPGVRTREEIGAVVAAAGPKPVNVLMSEDAGLRVANLAEMGVRRVSVGSALARTGWGAFMRAARGIRDEGSFAGFEGAASFEELSGLFGSKADRS